MAPSRTLTLIATSIGPFSAIPRRSRRQTTTRRAAAVGNGSEAITVEEARVGLLSTPRRVTLRRQGRRCGLELNMGAVQRSAIADDAAAAELWVRMHLAG